MTETQPTQDNGNTGNFESEEELDAEAKDLKAFEARIDEILATGELDDTLRIVDDEGVAQVLPVLDSEPISHLLEGIEEIGGRANVFVKTDEGIAVLNVVEFSPEEVPAELETTDQTETIYVPTEAPAAEGATSGAAAAASEAGASEAGAEAGAGAGIASEGGASPAAAAEALEAAEASADSVTLEGANGADGANALSAAEVTGAAEAEAGAADAADASAAPGTADAPAETEAGTDE